MRFCNLTLEEYYTAKLNFLPCLFALPAYLAQTVGKLHIYALQDDNEALIGIMPFVLRDKIAYNPPRATFGGWYSDQDLPIVFLDWVKKDLYQNNIDTLVIKLPPLLYNNATIDYIMAQPIQEIITDLNYHLILAQDFEEKLHHSAYRRLKKARQASFDATHWQNPDLPAVYNFIRQARLRKGFPITLTFEQFAEMFVLFPAYYDVFVVKDGDKIIALTVTVKISQDILYNFYPADAEDYLIYSPMIYLLDYVCSWAKTHGFQILDLGIATDAGKRNEGLIRFKKNVGATETFKHTVKMSCS